MITFVLIVIAYAGTMDGGVTSQQIEFPSATLCEAAKERVLTLGGQRGGMYFDPTVRAVCVAT